ncbi:MAG: hypothetical protein KatS3mg129_1850 [Leptospiraceae bacterium]|nr:MAG: hypothetical protein KatS3mg129_1850 [Leptospiraceae bacterium]
MQIRKKYGTNVYILDTKEIKQGGVLGTNFLSKKIYEIQVMIPEDNSPYKSKDFSYSLLSSKRNLENNLLKKQNTLTTEKNPELKIENTKVNKKINIEKEPKEMNRISPKLEEAENQTIETDLSDIDNLIRSLQQLKNEKLSELEESTINKKNLETDINLNKDKKIKESISDDTIIHKKTNDELKEQKQEKNISKEANNKIELTLEKPTKEEIHALLNYDSYKVEQSKNYDYFSDELEDKEKFLLRIRNKLIQSEFSEEFTHKFFQVLKRKLPSIEERNPREFHKLIVNELSHFIYYDPDLVPIPDKTKVIFFVGPNGSGKTTSLAKVSAKMKLENKYNISIISLDDYRLAATEQLKTYCNILNIPFYAPVKIDEYLESIIRDNADFVFIDTPGLSLKDKERLNKIKKYIDKTECKEVHLVLSATMRYDLIEKYISFFNILNFNKMILTGLDEVNFSGFFIELADKIKRPYSFFMNGQDVPDDILEIEIDELVEMLIK